jgi:predicted nucleotidyltransferase
MTLAYYMFSFDAPPVAYAKAFFGLKEGLEALFGRPVDLLTTSSPTNPYLRRRVTDERQMVYAS